MAGNPGLWLLICAALILLAVLVGDIFNMASSPSTARVSIAGGLLAGAVLSLAFAFIGLI
jgi:hypothetical protein